MNTPVNFELAKLLKEKGFDEDIRQAYNIENGNYTIFLNNAVTVKAPTIAEIVMWLYEKHAVWIDVSLNQFSKPDDLQWMYSILFTEDCTYSHSPKSFNSPTEAYEAAIEYVLTKLILKCT